LDLQNFHQHSQGTTQILVNKEEEDMLEVTSQVESQTMSFEVITKLK